MGMRTPGISLLTEPPRPPIRILHQMARSGGTVISRCIGAMRDVVLLSEIHPDAFHHYHPLSQAADWYQLFSAEEVSEIVRVADPLNTIRIIAGRCAELGQHLVIREWSHWDYIGTPYCRPAFRSTLSEILAPHFELRRIATVRHPLDQWLSLTRLFPAMGELDLSKTMRGCRAFAKMADAVGFHRYEDFVADPDRGLSLICEQIKLPFDASYRNAWQTNDKVTGDIHGNRAGDRIQVLPRQPVPDDLRGPIERIADYQTILNVLNYQR